MSDYNDGLLPTPCLRMDTHFGDEYESVEFGDGTGYIKAAPILAKVGALHEEIDRLRDESAELRELCADLYCLAYPSTVEWEVSDATYDKYSPCEKCHELHGGKSPCAGTSKDMTEECCAPIQGSVVADRMRELGVDI